MLKEDIIALVNSFSDNLRELASRHDSPHNVSASNVSKRLIEHSLKNRAKDLINTFSDVWYSHMDVYMALLQGNRKSIQDAEVKNLVKMALQMKKTSISNSIKILSVKAEVLISEAEEFEIELANQPVLSKLEHLTFEDLLAAWDNGKYPLE